MDRSRSLSLVFVREQVAIYFWKTGSPRRLGSQQTMAMFRQERVFLIACLHRAWYFYFILPLFHITLGLTFLPFFHISLRGEPVFQKYPLTKAACTAIRMQSHTPHANAGVKESGTK